jgi:hypothetical protein
VVQMLRDWNRHNVSYAIQLVRPTDDEVARALSVQPLFSAGLIYAPVRDWCEILINQAATFPKANMMTKKWWPRRTSALRIDRGRGPSILAREVASYARNDNRPYRAAIRRMSQSIVGITQGHKRSTGRGNANNHLCGHYYARNWPNQCGRLSGAIESDSDRQRGNRNFTRHQGVLQSSSLVRARTLLGASALLVSHIRPAVVNRIWLRSGT